jgi:integrase
MYVRPYKEKFRFAESYADPLTGRKREVSVILDKNTNASRKEAAAILQRKIKEKSHVTPDSMRFGELIDRFVRYQYQMRKESTAKQDEAVLAVLRKLIGSDVLVTKITAPIIRDRLDSTRKDATWKNIKIKHIKTLFRWAYRQGYVPDTSVVDRLERYPEPSSRQKVIGKYLESDQLREVISSMDTHTDYQLLTRFLVLSGCRIGEAIALTVKDADMDAHELRIDKTYSLNTNKIQSTKTEMSERTIHMRPELFDLVKTVLHRQKQICLSYGVRTNLLFPWKDGGYMHYVAYSKYFRDHVEKVIGHPLPVHSLRHTYTSLMAEAGIPIETISRQLGHADSSVTREIYMHVTDKMRKADNERLDAVKIL